MDKKIGVITGALVIFGVTSFLSYYLLRNNPALQLKSVVTAPKKLGEQVSFDATLPKTEPCPINGVLYSTPQKDWWRKHRPLVVMIENHLDSRPQSGFSYADVTYEAVAEGGITRTMNIFYCQDAGIVGPVRSARTYFLDYASEYGSNPLYAHVGGANTSGPADALGQIEQYGWGGYNDLNQFSIGYPVFWRDYDRLGHAVATEHTMYSTTTKLWDFAAQNRGLTNLDKIGASWDKGFIPYSFKDDVDLATRPAAQTINFDFWPGYSDYSVEWDYDKTSNTYLRKNGGSVHLDKDTGKQLTAKNVVILFETEARANDGYEGNLHMIYGTKGLGKASIFMDGKQIMGKWSKATRTARTLITDSSGVPVQFDRGKIWFEIVAIGNQITVK